MVSRECMDARHVVVHAFHCFVERNNIDNFLACLSCANEIG